jgi:hypothetical protein
MGVSAVEYVMVPVPEELAPQVLSYVTWKGLPVLGAAAEAAAKAPEHAAEGPDGDEGGDPIPRAFARLDDAGRSLATILAEAALRGEELSVSHAARRAGTTAREFIGTVIELNNLVEGEGGPPMAVWIKTAEGADEDEFSWDNRVVMMPEPVARPFASLVRAHTAT